MVGASIKQLESLGVNDEQKPNQSIMEQFEQLVVSSLFKAFGLNPLLFDDKNGGNVDTITTARKYGLKSEANIQAYENRGDYNSNDYHGGGKTAGYGAKNAALSILRDEGQLVDAYTGERLTGKFDLDHVISAKEIHNDQGRVLAGLNGVDLANQDSNLNATNFSINRSKKADKMDVAIERLKMRQSQREQQLGELKAISNPTPEQQKQIEKYENLLKADFEMMKDIDKGARKIYDQQLAKAYYTGDKFLKDAGKDALNTGYKMGLRQVLGLLFAEVWISVRKGIKILIERMKQHFDIKEFFLAIGDIFKSTMQNVIAKHKQFIQAFKEGIISGILSSITTTIVNIFVGTAKRITQVIRECWASIVEITKILFFSEEHTSFGEKMKAVAKVLVGFVTILLGTVIHEAVLKIPGIGQIPIIGDALAIFLSAMVTGIISIGLLYFIDHSKEVMEFFKFSYWLKDNIEEKKQEYRNLNDQLGKKVAELASIPYDEIQRLITKVNTYNAQIEGVTSSLELNKVLTAILNHEQINIGYNTRDELREKMHNKNNRFVFE